VSDERSNLQGEVERTYERSLGTGILLTTSRGQRRNLVSLASLETEDSLDPLDYVSRTGYSLIPLAPLEDLDLLQIKEHSLAEHSPSGNLAILNLT
jgi:hypothetical protein